MPNPNPHRLLSTVTYFTCTDLIVNVCYVSGTNKQGGTLQIQCICEIVLGRRESLLVQNKEKLDTLLVESPLPDKIFQCTVSTLCLDQQDVPGHWSILETRTLSNGKSPYTLRFDKLSNTPAVLVRLRPQKHVVGIQLSLSFRILRGKGKMCW